MMLHSQQIMFQLHLREKPGTGCNSSIEIGANTPLP